MPQHPEWYPEAEDAVRGGPVAQQPPWAAEVWRGPAQPYLNELPPRRNRRVDMGLVAFILVAAGFLAWQYTVSVEERALREHRATTFVYLPMEQPGGESAAMSLDDAERFAATYITSRDAGGSYVESSRAIAAAFGVTMRWDSAEDSTTACAPSDLEAPTVPLAFFCALEPYVIYLNADSPWMPAYLYEPDLIDTVKHELAHHAILLRCGDLEVWDVPDEGLTNSYAVQFLGADKGRLTDGLPSDSEYVVTEATDAYAQRVHEGDCG